MIRGFVLTFTEGHDTNSIPLLKECEMKDRRDFTTITISIPKDCIGMMTDLANRLRGRQGDLWRRLLQRFLHKVLKKKKPK